MTERVSYSIERLCRFKGRATQRKGYTKGPTHRDELRKNDEMLESDDRKGRQKIEEENMLFSS